MNALARFAFAVKHRIIPPSIAWFEPSEFGDGMMLVCRRAKDIFKLLCIPTANGVGGPECKIRRYIASCYTNPPFEPVQFSVEGKDGNFYTDETKFKIYHSILQPGNDLSEYNAIVSSTAGRLALEKAQRKEQKRLRDAESRRRREERRRREGLL
jgi:hypothetical protein